MNPIQCFFFLFSSNFVVFGPQNFSIFWNFFVCSANSSINSSSIFGKMRQILDIT
jgi:hypothetical protein